MYEPDSHDELYAAALAGNGCTWCLATTHTEDHCPLKKDLLRTITGVDGHTDLGGGVEFTPTSKDGDGSVFFQDRYVGKIYFDRTWPDAYHEPDHSIVTFTALSPVSHEPLGKFELQREAIDALVETYG